MSDGAKPTTVGELMAFLGKLPPDREVLYQCFSDYDALRLEDIEVGGAVPQTSYWMRDHPTMSAENLAKRATYVIFPGN